MNKTFDDAWVTTCSVHSGITSFSELEARRYWQILSALDADAIVVEIGLQFGRSSSLVAQAAAEIGFLHIGIDPFADPLGAEARLIPLMASFGHRFELLKMMSGEAAGALDSLAAGVDVGLIDGDHWADGVRVDVALLKPRIKRGGFLLFHDYGVGLPNVYPPVDPAFVKTLMEGEEWEEEEPSETLGVWRRG